MQSSGQLGSVESAAVTAKGRAENSEVPKVQKGTDQNAKEQILACGARSTRVYAEAKRWNHQQRRARSTKL
jgi:hypothetical protein